MIEAQYIPAYPIVVIKENERVFADDDEIKRDVISNLLALDEIDFDEIE